jgi:hypothetical protein
MCAIGACRSGRSLRRDSPNRGLAGRAVAGPRAWRNTDNRKHDPVVVITRGMLSTKLICAAPSPATPWCRMPSPRQSPTPEQSTRANRPANGDQVRLSVSLARTYLADGRIALAQHSPNPGSSIRAVNEATQPDGSATTTASRLGRLARRSGPPCRDGRRAGKLFDGTAGTERDGGEPRNVVTRGATACAGWSR